MSTDIASRLSGISHGFWAQLQCDQAPGSNCGIHCLHRIDDFWFLRRLALHHRSGEGATARWQSACEISSRGVLERIEEPAAALPRLARLGHVHPHVRQRGPDHRLVKLELFVARTAHFVEMLMLGDSALLQHPHKITQLADVQYHANHRRSMGWAHA